MDESLVFINGDYVPRKDAKISVFDWGVRGGDAVYEVLRTYSHKLMFVEKHVARLRESLSYLYIDLETNDVEIIEIITNLISRNRTYLNPNDDFAIWLLITRGDQLSLDHSSPTFIAFCEHINFKRFSRRYINGVNLRVPSIRRTPAQCVNPRAKTTNRANQLTALWEVQAEETRALPLMLDTYGFVSETNSANFFFVTDRKIRTPEDHNILNGVTRESVINLAEQSELEFEKGSYELGDVLQADEAFITSTVETILPVASIDGVALKKSVPGPVTMEIIRSWNRLTGTDLVLQGIGHLENETKTAFLSKWKHRKRLFNI